MDRPRPIIARFYAGAGTSAALVLAAVLAACAADEGRSRRARRADEALEAPPAPEVPRRRWPHAGELAGLRVVQEDVRSTHFTGDAVATLRANAAAEGYGRRGVSLPAGALLVATHARPDGLVHFAMERPSPGSGAERAPWSFAVIDAEGWIVAEGRLESCVRCHAEAPVDEVFGPPGL